MYGVWKEIKKKTTLSISSSSLPSTDPACVTSGGEQPRKFAAKNSADDLLSSSAARNVIKSGTGNTVHGRGGGWGALQKTSKLSRASAVKLLGDSCALNSYNNTH